MWQNKSLFYTIVSEYIIILSTHYIIVFFYSTSVYVLFGPGIYTVKFKHCKMRSLFRNKKFVLDEKLEWNASNFVILLEYKYPNIFVFLIHTTNLFSPLLNIVYVNKDQGIHCLKKICKKWKQKKIFGFSNLKNMAKFEAFHWDNFIKHKLLLSEFKCDAFIRSVFEANRSKVNKSQKKEKESQKVKKKVS